MAAVVAGNSAGVGGNIAAAVYYQKTAQFFSAASAAYALNNTADGDHFSGLAYQQEQIAGSTESLQSFCEIAVLLLIIVAFAAVGTACARRVSTALLLDMNDAAAAAGQQLRRQIVGTAAFVFVTFLLRAVYSTMFALANRLQNSAASCPSSPNANPCDASCYNVYRLVQLWLIYTPEFQLIIELISSPLALLVSLWGMTSPLMLVLMQSSRRRQKGVLQDRMLRGTCTG